MSLSFHPLDGVYNVKIHSDASGGGILDDGPQIQACINEMQSTGGGQLYFPPGVYLCNSGLTISEPTVIVQGSGSDQVASGPGLRQGSVLTAGAAMTDLLKFTFATATQGGQAMYEMFLDGNGLATNVLTIDAQNVQVLNSDIRRPATNGAAVNITANGASAWLSNVRPNCANQAGTTGVLVGGTDLTMSGCKCVNSVYGVQLLTGASGAQLNNNHHTPGSTIGVSAFWMNGNPNHIHIVANRIDNHALGSGIQLSAAVNCQSILIADNVFAQSVITDNTFAAIGVDTSAANYYGLKVLGNTVRNINQSNRYASLLTSQVLAGTAATNPTRMSSQGTIASGNTVHAPVLFGTSSNPLAARGNVLSVDGTTWTAPADI